MKHSIKKIFTNLVKFLAILASITTLISLLTLETHISYEKVNNLKNQKDIIHSLVNLKKYDIELALIQFNAKSNQLRHEIKKLRKLHEYDYTSKFIFSTSKQYLANLDKLKNLTDNFNEAAKNYYVEDIKDEKLKKEELKKAFISIEIFIDSMLLNDITYKEQKFYMFEKIVIVLFILSIFTLFWYRKRLKLIHDDLLGLYAIDKHHKDLKIFSQEADAIRLRMNRKPIDTDNPAMIDPVTQIKNHLGMLSSFANKKDLKDSNFISVTIFEIDNFSKQKRTFSQEFTQSILKKVAFSISLHEQATDVIARTDYNQFTVILSRASKEQSFKDIDLIRQSISEIKFKEPKGKEVTITVTGGYVIKPTNQNIEEAIKKAKEVLSIAKKTNKNHILKK